MHPLQKVDEGEQVRNNNTGKGGEPSYSSRDFLQVGSVLPGDVAVAVLAAAPAAAIPLLGRTRAGSPVLPPLSLVRRAQRVRRVLLVLQGVRSGGGL